MVSPAAIPIAVALIAVGAALVFDYRGVATRMKTQTDDWWSAGPIRRRLNRGGSSPRWSLGVPTLIAGVLILIAAIFVYASQ